MKIMQPSKKTQFVSKKLLSQLNLDWIKMVLFMISYFLCHVDGYTLSQKIIYVYMYVLIESAHMLVMTNNVNKNIFNRYVVSIHMRLKIELIYILNSQLLEYMLFN
jgi:hypothetical protein